MRDLGAGRGTGRRTSAGVTVRLRSVRVMMAIVGTAGIVAGTGCGTGGPTAPASQKLSTHFDGLYVEAMLAATHADSLRSAVLSYLELASAEGAAPVPVTVTTASGTQTWQALSYTFADTSGSASASTVAATIVYSDSNVTNAVVAVVTTGFGAGVSAELLAADTIYVAQTTATALATVTNAGACLFPSQGGYADQIFTTVASMYHCNLATFQSSLTASFPSTPGVDPGLTQMSFATLTSNGVRLTDASP